MIKMIGGKLFENYYLMNFWIFYRHFGFIFIFITPDHLRKVKNK